MRLKLFPYLIIVFLFLSACAKIGSPTGGVKDSLPPVLIKGIPENRSIEFKSKKIKLYFNEYIQLKELRKNWVASPPLKYFPIITPQGGVASKSITISILDTLQENATYVLNFGKSVIDNNEGNPYPNFNYVFSTGNTIDSLSTSGSVTHPLSKEEISDIKVLLYEYNNDFYDSIIYHEKPRYVGSTLDTTLFNINHLKKGAYLILALKDANNDYFYNPKTDLIGFQTDTLFIPSEEKIHLRLFKEVPSFKIVKSIEASKGHLIFGYEGKPKNVLIEPLLTEKENIKSYNIFEKNKDTLNYWFTATKEIDSFVFKVSSGNYIDTVKVRLRKSKSDSLRITAPPTILELSDTLKLKTNTPLIEFNTELVILKQDSLPVSYNHRMTPSNDGVQLHFEKRYNSQYEITLLPNAIKNLFNQTNDTLSYRFKAKSPKDYGIIKLDLSSSKKFPLLVELMNQKNEVVRSTIINKPGISSFIHLNPASYFFRVTHDANKNNKRDSGNYLKRIQPEYTLFYRNKPIELKANWEIVESINFN